MLASNGVTVLAVQVKQGGHFAESDRRQLAEWAGWFKAKPCLARKRRGQWVVEDVAS